MKKLVPGKYEAKPKQWGLGTTSKGNPQVIVLFGIDDQDGDHHEMTWFGTLKEGRGQEITLDSLLFMGFKGNDLTTLADGVEGGALDMDTPVSITIAEETNEKGQTFMKVQWVNRVGGAAFKDALSKKEAQVKLG